MIKVVTAPAIEPVTLAEVRAQLSIPTADTSVDAIITRRIIEAREWVEEFCGRALISRVYEAAFDFFPPEIELLNPPAASVTSIKYLDVDGIEQTIDSADYLLDIYREPGWVTVGYGKSWPTTRDVINAVKVQWVAGYGATTTSIPGPIREAIMLIVGHWMRYQPQVESGVSITRIPYAVEHLLQTYRVMRF
jgi:uncharacterized phiE125 gp8 family phage protein